MRWRVRSRRCTTHPLVSVRRAAASTRRSACPVRAIALAVAATLSASFLPAPLKEGGTFRAPRLLFFRAGRFHSGKQCARQRIEIERIGSGGRDKLAKLLDLLHLQRPGLVAKGFQLRVIVARFAHHSLPRSRKLKPQVSLIARARNRSEQKKKKEHTSELQSLMRISYAVFCLTKQKTLPRLDYTTLVST